MPAPIVVADSITRAGIGGLDYLSEHTIAAATVGHETAHIGDAVDRGPADV